MLVELHQQFNVIDLAEDFLSYKLILLPDEIAPSKPLLEKLDSFIAVGGAVIASAASLLDPKMFWFYWKPLGIRYQGKAPFQGAYLLPKPGAFPSLDQTPYCLYQPDHAIAADEGMEVLATYGHPYFDRAPQHFSSHKQTPIGQRTESPVITLRGRVAYIANPFFRSYALDGAGAYKLIVDHLIHRLLPQPAVVTPHLQSTAQVTALMQSGQRRIIVHLLHYLMTRRAPNIDIIGEPEILLNQELRVRVKAAPKQVMLAPQNKPLSFRI